jgi:hypothetical protein
MMAGLSLQPVLRSVSWFAAALKITSRPTGRPGEAVAHLSPAACVRTTINVQNLSGYAAGFGQADHGISNFCRAGDRAHGGEGLQEVLRVGVVDVYDAAADVMCANERMFVTVGPRLQRSPPITTAWGRGLSLIFSTGTKRHTPSTAVYFFG